MDDGPKVAAAILAAEASRQRQALKQGAFAKVGYDISAELLDYYWHFLNETRKGERQTG